MAEELSKLEKLEKRRQQLAKWKLKKVSGDTSQESAATVKSGEPPVQNAANPMNDRITSEIESTQLSPEELKKIERQRKLEEWKRKKQQANTPGSKPPSESPQPEIQAGAASLLNTGQDRLDSWKKKKTGLNTAITLKSVKPLSRKRGLLQPKPSVFGGEEDEEVDHAPRFKAPSAPKSNYNRAPETNPKRLKTEETIQKDELDIFIESLEPAESSLETGIPNTKSGAKTKEAPVFAAPLMGVEEEEEEEEDSEDEDDKLILAKMKNLAKGKELAKVDHSQIAYMPFKKDFYVEPPSIAGLTADEVKSLRIELDGIKVSGKNVPRPIWDWAQLGLSPLVLSVMQDKLSYTKPTLIQLQALPAIMSGRDFMGVAKTGSGKTLAFVLPLLSHVQAQPALEKGDGPIGVLLTPTRELALQIFKQLSYFTKKLGISACCCYGGLSIEPQIAELKKGSQIVVATPGRLIDLLAANNGRVCNLRRVTYIVLDEADRMFDFGFEPQVNRIFAQIRPDRQSILFSATFAKKMESLARAVLNDPVEVVVGGISVVAPEIAQKIEFFESDSSEIIYEKKFARLLEVLSMFPGVKKLVFVEKQDSADDLLVKLLAHKIPCVAIHGGKEQIDRKYAIREFSSKDSGVDVLIATSIAARGLDVKGLDLVVNFDPPNHMEDYVHRVGRTGRAGNHGDAYTFVTADQERPITDLVKALRLSKVPEAEIDPRLVKIADAFLAKVKEGKEKFRFGFGGNGLNKLDETRNTTKSMERRAYDVPGESKSVSMPKAQTLSKESEFALDLPEFKVIEGRADETAGPDKCKFHSRVTINDLPQKARWVVVNADNLAQIIEATSTSITNKGQYYAPKVKIPATVKQGGRDVPAPPKLYLLIEGLTENAVSEANRMIRQKMIEGLEQAAADEGLSAPGKYTV
ncbi:ATP-dependent RNA helicase DDX46/PRP5 [Metschnikowia aff. pulcherrima]|uniref:RNA helicase n=1 Tax=Metschnikowia aff. pulcherrima TaxID=2163413 RepID=A0A4P6XMZ8_9ASCO|nr:ATP-dependent RNA helicase DDX46/PRP5 [Metschnikowia aff. pulcherrima]